MVGPNPISPTKLAVKTGVSKSALWKWRKDALEARKPGVNAEVLNVNKKKSQKWSAQEKLRVVLEAAALGDEELGAFLRREGVHEPLLELWKQEMVEGLEGASQQKRTAKRQAEQDSHRIRTLERELARKERALTEAAALLLLQKKVRQIWGDEDDAIDPSSEQ